LRRMTPGRDSRGPGGGHMSRRGRTNFLGILVLAAVVYGVLCARAFFPAWWTNFQVKEIVTESLMEWRDNGGPEMSDRLAKAKLTHLLDDMEIPAEIVFLADSCQQSGCCFEMPFPGERHVDCAWGEEVKLPFLNKWVPLDFRVHRYLDAENHLHNVKEGGK
jgi:hypothetical protein